jgi:hypothetical protein
MKNITLSFLFLLQFSAQLFAKNDTISVEKAYVSKLIQLDIKGKGGYQDDCVEMQITSMSSDPVIIYIEAGRRLDSKDSTEQDILIVKDIFVSLPAYKKESVGIRGFCCQANNHAPKMGSVFFVGALAYKDLYQLARYLDTTKLTNNSIQAAIWIISDGHELSSLVNDGSKEVEELQKSLAKIKRVKIPWYSTIYKKEKDKLFSGIPESITGMIEYTISDFSLVVVNIRDAKGTIVKSMLVGKNVARGTHQFKIEWNVLDVPKGTYVAYVAENGRKLKELPIELK